MSSVILEILLAGIFILITGGGVLAYFIYQFSLVRKNTLGDAALILGNAVNDDGTPSNVFASRIQHGVDLYHANKVKYLIMTGGLAKNEKFVESEVAKQYAIEKGVPPSDIFQETQSRMTYENFVFADPIIQEKGFKRILIVSDPLHMKRAMAIAKNFDFNAYSSPVPDGIHKLKDVDLIFLFSEVVHFTICQVLGKRTMIIPTQWFRNFLQR